ARPSRGSSLPAAEAQATDYSLALDQLADAAQFSPKQKARFETELRYLHRFMGLRETCKHYLMKGYAQIRRILVELDRRFGLAGGVFYLTLEELPQLIGGEDLNPAIASRRQRRAVALSLDVPPVIFSDDLEAVGRKPVVEFADSFKGTPLSAGTAEGPAL